MNEGKFLADINKTLDGLGIVDNADVLRKADDGVISTDTTNFGGLLPRAVVEQLLANMYKQDTWLASLKRFTRAQRNGIVPILELNGNVTEGIGENEAPTNLKRPATRQITYSCKSFVAYWQITLDELYEAKAAGMTNFEETVLAAFGTAIGNDKARIVMNGDTTLNDSTSLNRMLRMVNGILVKAEAGNVLDAEGKALAISSPNHFGAMEDVMPDIYADDPGLRWLYNRRVDSHYRALLMARATALGDKSLTDRELGKPNGIPPVIVPQISSNMGPTAIAPTSAADHTTHIELVLTTLVTAVHVASAAAGVGRKFLVTCVPTGHTETCTGFLDTTLRIQTAGLLGQTTVSATASDYTVGLYDETVVLHMNPQGVSIVDCYEMEAYREFVPRLRRWEFLSFFHMDLLIPTPEAIVKLKRLGVTPLSVT